MVAKLQLCPLQGIEPTGNRVMRPALFTVDTFSAGQGQVMAYLDHPDGTREEVHSRASNPYTRLKLLVVKSNVFVSRAAES